ncbi:MAG: UDP-N-acetylmuramoyl-L-alanyl-D-glutamate--2,6-diaminopimelate ligase [Deltaproteobacteria bacterium]|jgi:UDP-N-acetylmuramoyl-L-alanyl-D-glutamate--2,6-diaminopimelate ligase|nr:UDP-N-acetylmuramoyl-L-alanyl-D-glutamate--2,6-diaminopimelate ligase [Deltaproteobacteria bacterium]
MHVLEQNFNTLLELAARQETSPAVHSAKVRPGDAFVALPPSMEGGKGGLDFVPEALSRRARFLVCAPDQTAEIEHMLKIADMPHSPEIIPVPDCRAALGELAAARFASRPEIGLLCGITGTNGKTSCAFLLEHLFTQAGYKVGVIGTVNYRWPGASRPAALTTPGCLELHELIGAMKSAGADTAFMEVSSHALAQNRVAGLHFHGALWTNLSQDHLDFHPDMEDYHHCKARLFYGPAQGGPPPEHKARAVNADDPYGLRLLRACAALPGRTIAYGLEDKKLPVPLLHGEILSLTPQGLHLRQHFQGQSWELRSPLVGRFNAMNLMGAQAMALALGLEARHLPALEGFTGVPGRLERIANNRELHVFVDYAHTPDALEKAIKALRDAGFKRIITVFGCGGNRDRSKRPLMGRTVSGLSDVAVLTSDNPRLEDPQAIIQDVLPGMRGKAETHVQADRRAATVLALSLARSGDALLVAGKGHEDYMIIGADKIHYSDQETLRELLGTRNGEL